MMANKTILKKQIDQSAPNEMIVLSVSPIEKNSLEICQKEIEKYIKTQHDYVIVVIRKRL